MELLFLLGRILYGGYFVFSGINHFSQLKSLSGYAASKKVPLPELAVMVSGLLLLAGGLGILLWIYVKFAVAALVLFLVPVSLMMHNFWGVTDQQARMTDMIMFMKNMALLGAALIFLSLK